MPPCSPVLAAAVSIFQLLLKIASIPPTAAAALLVPPTLGPSGLPPRPRCCARLSLSSSSVPNEGPDTRTIPCCEDRRSTLIRSSILSTGAVSLVLSGTPLSAIADTNTNDHPNQEGLRCLQSLPRPPHNTIRVYLCRHGETENNRKSRLMGARIDQGLNDVGQTMSQRIGMALSYLDDGGSGGSRSSTSDLIIPRVAVHSPLKRSIETAEIASASFGASRGDTNDEMPLRLQSTLGGLDYGESYTGRPSADVESGMLRTYAAWSDGKLDEQMDGGGETGLNVLTRAAATLRDFARIGTEAGGAILAVSHSSFLRILLAMVLDMRLDEGMSTMVQDNGCINVLDIDTSAKMGRVGRGSKILGGVRQQSSVPANFNLTIPKVNIVRINECRHLG